MFLFLYVLIEFHPFVAHEDYTGMRSFKYQAQKYPKRSTTYIKRNSIVLLPFTVINQHLGCSAGFWQQDLYLRYLYLRYLCLRYLYLSYLYLRYLYLKYLYLRYSYPGYYIWDIISRN